MWQANDAQRGVRTSNTTNSLAQWEWGASAIDSARGDHVCSQQERGVAGDRLVCIKPGMEC